MNPETIRREALNLPIEKRAQLAEQLLASLDDLPEAELELLWLAEAARRADETDRGLVQRIPAETVLAEARALLAK